MIKLQAKRFDLNFLLKFSDLKSNFTLTLGYLNPVLNNRDLGSIRGDAWNEMGEDESKYCTIIHRSGGE